MRSHAVAKTTATASCTERTADLSEGFTQQRLHEAQKFGRRSLRRFSRLIRELHGIAELPLTMLAIFHRRGSHRLEHRQ